MSELIASLDALKPETLKLLETVVTAGASLLGVIIAAILGKFLASVWLNARDKQDKEMEWRNHAIELTKLDLERKIKARKAEDSQPIRPSILDFLANYRDLQELGDTTPKDLYLKIESSRIKKPVGTKTQQEANKQLNQDGSAAAPSPVS